MRFSGENPSCSGNRVIFRQAERTCDIVCRSHREISDWGRTLNLHQSGNHLAEGSVAPDTRYHVVVLRIICGKFRCLARSCGKKQRNLIPTVCQYLHGIAEIVAVSAAAGIRVHNQHHSFHASFSPPRKAQGTQILRPFVIPARMSISPNR